MPKVTVIFESKQEGAVKVSLADAKTLQPVADFEAETLTAGDEVSVDVAAGQFIRVEETAEPDAEEGTEKATPEKTETEAGK